jgi:type I restriction enzyme S subunit
VIPLGSVIMTCVGKFGISAIVEKRIVVNQQLHAFLPVIFFYNKYLAYCIQYNKVFF